VLTNAAGAIASNLLTIGAVGEQTDFDLGIVELDG
jgi:hypothetical protein